MIGFVTALREERVAVRRSFLLSPGGSLQGLELEFGEGVVHLCTGMGAERVARGVALLQRVYQPSLMVLCGFSVGLWPELKVGDLLCDERSHSGLLKSVEGLDGVTIGRMAACGFLTTAGQKGAFAEKNPECPAADMESDAFLSSVQPPASCLVLRVVSDDVRSSLPIDISQLVDSKGFPDQKGIALALARRPMALPGLLRLAGDSQRAVMALTGGLSRLRPELEALAGRVS